MKNKVKIIGITTIAFIIFILFNVNNANAASANISGKTSVNKGESVTITASVNAGAWNLTLSGAGQSVKLVGQTNTTGNISDSKSITFVANQNTTFTLTGDITDYNEEVTPISKSITVNVNQSTSSSSSAASNTNSTNSESQKKSNNANLSNLGIRPNDFSGFKAGTTTYNVTVPKNVEEVEVYAKAQDSKSKVAGTGKKKLQEGKNTATVTVTAEDGTKKTYTINITRSTTEEDNESEEEGEDDPEADDNNETNPTEAKGLSELKIGNLELSPAFRTDIYEYTAKYIGEDTKLDVSTITTEDDYTIEVIGNEDLKEGENIITILVSDTEGNNVATYQITVNKSLVQETLPEKQDENGMKILGIIVGVVIVVIIIFLIVRHRRNKKWGEEYSTSFTRLGDEEEENVYKNQLEDFDENMKSTKRKEVRDITQDKKIAKEQYLKNFNSNDNEYPEWQEETVKKRRTKGKRFK